MALLRTPLNQKREIYSDIPNTFDLSPINSDVTRVTNEEAVKQSIRNLLLTDRGERPFQRDFGSDIKSMLFEPATPIIATIMEDHIKEFIRLKEPRCNLIDVTVSAMVDSNQVEVTFLYNIINSTETLQYTLILDRVR